MSNTIINIRVLWWHLQVTYSYKFSIAFNKWYWVKKGLLKPFEVYDFKPFEARK